MLEEVRWLLDAIERRSLVAPRASLACRAKTALIKDHEKLEDSCNPYASHS